MNVLIIDKQDVYINGIIHGLKDIDHKCRVYRLTSIIKLEFLLNKIELYNIIIDGDMQKTFLIEILSRIRDILPNVPVIFITNSNKTYDISSYKEFSISAVLERNTSIINIYQIISMVGVGFRCFSKNISIVDPIKKKLSVLSERKEQILKLILKGHTNKQIARILNISPGTVKSHIETIFVTLNVNNRIKAATTYFNKEVLTCNDY